MDPEDIEDLLVKVEKSFNIKFKGRELADVKNFGEMCDHIANKIKLDNLNDCTSQQAFYKLRDAISAELNIERSTITSQQKLSIIFPRNNRRSYLKRVEVKLGFQLNVLTPPSWQTLTLLSIFILSLIGFFFSWKLAISGITFSLLGFWLSDKAANEIGLETMEQLVKKVTTENYLKSRRNPKSFNKIEIEKILINWFSTEFDVDKRLLTRDAKIV
ncbi:hypothetical protein AB669_18075 [Pedobacter sp. BMA]|nr:hypothetical protein AB669_18075 [Pedobacter sp. BMA]